MNSQIEHTALKKKLVMRSIAENKHYLESYCSVLHKIWLASNFNEILKGSIG